MSAIKPLLLFLSILSNHPAIAQTSPAEVQRISYFKLATDVNAFVAVAADRSGVYAASNVNIHKYDARGNELWTQSLDAGGYVAGAASDGAGAYVLIVLQSSARCVLQRFTPAGMHLWSRELDTCSSLAADPTGVYVYRPIIASSKAELDKYSPDNTALWTREVDTLSIFGEDGFIRSVGFGRMAADTTGVYVVAANINAAAVIAHKWSVGGADLWTRPLKNFDIPRKLAADATGFYLLAGDRQGRTFLRKYDLNGAELWSSESEPTPDPNLVSLAADGSGAYVAARIEWPLFTVLPGQCKSGSGSDSYLRKYNAGTGEEVWTREFGTAQAAWASGLAVTDGSVYVVGEEGTAQVQSDFEHIDAFRPANPTRAGFLARFESAVVSARSGPRIVPDCVVNAASYTGGGVAPWEIVTIFGTEIGPSQPVALQVNPDGRLATMLADTRVLFDGIPAPLLYVSGMQTSAIVPSAVAGKSTVDVQVEHDGVRSVPVTLPVLDARPGIFSMDGSGEGQAAIQNEDGSWNSPSNPAQRGSVITLYATGGAETAPGLKDGQIVSDLLPSTTLPVWVFFDLTDNEFPVPSKAAQILYSGGVPGAIAGLLQINLRVPPDVVRTGDRVPFLLIIGSHWTVYQVRVALR